MYGFLSDILRNLVKAWRGGNRAARLIIAAAATVALLAAIVAFVGPLLGLYPFLADRFSAALAILATLLAAGVSAYQDSLDRVESERRVLRVEQRYEDNPAEPHAAWDLARVKLEKYIERNLAQVQSIFWLTAAVSVVGFLLIAYAIVEVFANPALFRPALLAAASGVLLNFLGATFMIIYRSTMAQASSYVTVLERINAVGMAVQVLESLKENPDLHQETTAQLAGQLLRLYSPSERHGSAA
jgi:hypothetical protein